MLLLPPFDLCRSFFPFYACNTAVTGRPLACPWIPDEDLAFTNPPSHPTKSARKCEGGSGVGWTDIKSVQFGLSLAAGNSRCRRRRIARSLPGIIATALSLGRQNAVAFSWTSEEVVAEQRHDNGRNRGGRGGGGGESEIGPRVAGRHDFCSGIAKLQRRHIS